ncbi:Fic family protein [Romboutsia sp.]|uniref:Fic family protein n=1 Tax=Romboutsia sp. TaxID=1965302 RepID=UPI003F31403F
MQSFIPRYKYTFKNILPNGDKRYILTYVRQMISEFVYDMGSLENNPFTFPEVQTLLDGITVGGHKLSDQNQILNIKESWDFILKLSTNEEIKINKDTICSIHNIVARDEALIVGDFRNGNIGIAGTVEYKCIDAKDLQEVFENDIKFIENINNPLEKAIVLNLWLSYCQFFYDGNKRTSRLTSNLILLQNKIGVLSVSARLKHEYNSLMLEFYETLEADKVIEFLVEKCTTYFNGFDYMSYDKIVN